MATSSKDAAPQRADWRTQTIQGDQAMPQFDRTTMRFVVTIALLYCALIALNFGLFGVACTVAGDNTFGMRDIGYGLVAIALLHGVAGICILGSYRSYKPPETLPHETDGTATLSTDSASRKPTPANWPPALKYGLILAPLGIVVFAGMVLVGLVLPGGGAR